ncbi:response regulator [Limnoglobus roseus]|uniref:Response regulator n=1 Tax=Limnoglobus roseus TaxID=2598579 RepID=A0A5C1AF03_9BACT|nr:response regulator [Limnoglobus roseus]QEL16803.1 response regulator [Limnoglobus roseus]
MDVLRPHVLVVDDSPDAADSMADLCTLWGYDAAPRYSGAAALAAVRVRRPAVVLLDIGMAPMDGFAFTAHFRQLGGCGGTPVVVISGHTSAIHQARGRELGIRHYIFKPAEPVLLRALLEQLIMEPQSMWSRNDDQRRGAQRIPEPVGSRET